MSSENGQWSHFGDAFKDFYKRWHDKAPRINTYDALAGATAINVEKIKSWSKVILSSEK